MRQILGQLTRFLGVGAAMTVVGYVCILALTACGSPPLAANFIAYALLIAVSYWLHARITCRAGASAPGLLRYLGVVAVSYGANVLVLLALVDRLSPAAAQLAAVATYAAVQFVLARAFAYAPRKG